MPEAHRPASSIHTLAIIQTTSNGVRGLLGHIYTAEHTKVMVRSEEEAHLTVVIAVV